MADTEVSSNEVTREEFATLVEQMTIIAETQKDILTKLASIEESIKAGKIVEAETAVKKVTKPSVADLLKKSAKPAAAKAPVEEKEKKEKTPVEDDGTLRIITNYTDKAVVVMGRSATDIIKEAILKPMTFKFQMGFKYGPGWMIPRTKLDEFMRRLVMFNKTAKQKVTYEQLTKEEMDELASSQSAAVEDDLLEPATNIKSKAEKKTPASSREEAAGEAAAEQETVPVRRTLKKKPVASPKKTVRAKEESEEETN